MKLKDETGYILVAVMVVGLLVALIGFAASKMTDLGTTTYGSQKKYEIASAAADYAVNQAINSVSLTGTCPATTSSQMNDTNEANYQYLGIETGGYCFVRGQGTFRGAKVVKTVVVPDTSDFDYGALTLRNGGATATSGSSAIVSCDSACKSPAIVYGGSLTFTANLDKSSCNKGIYGIGEGGSDAIQSGAGVECSTSPCYSDTLTNRIPKIFNDASNWSALQDKLDATYNGHTVDVSALSVSGSPPTVSDSSCICTTGTGAVTLGSTSTCNGTTWTIPATCTAVQGASVTVTSLPGSITTVYGTGAVTVSGNVSNATIVGQTVTLGSGTISNSMITTAGTSQAITMGNASTNNSTIVTSGVFTMNKNSGTLTDTNMFAGSVNVINQGGNVAGGILYTQGNFDFNGTTSGNNNFGTWNTSSTPQTGNPVLILVGGNFDMTRMTGTTGIAGLIFVEGAFLTNGDHGGTGNFSITGAVVANSSTGTSSFNTTGNATLSFNHHLLDALSTRSSLNGLVKQTACGGTFGRKAFISNSKVTVF